MATTLPTRVRSFDEPGGTDLTPKDSALDLNGDQVCPALGSCLVRVVSVCPEEVIAVGAFTVPIDDADVVVSTGGVGQGRVCGLLPVPRDTYVDEDEFINITGRVDEFIDASPAGAGVRAESDDEDVRGIARDTLALQRRDSVCEGTADLGIDHDAADEIAEVVRSTHHDRITDGDYVRAFVERHRRFLLAAPRHDRDRGNREDGGETPKHGGIEPSPTIYRRWALASRRESVDDPR